jgi:hypothetical protein
LCALVVAFQVKKPDARSRMMEQGKNFYLQNGGSNLAEGKAK